MADVVLFNHVPKTAGSTMRRIVFDAVGPRRVLFVTTLDRHREELGGVNRRLRGLRRARVIIAHTGCGVERHLPATHAYPAFTMLREPVDRTLSLYFYSRASHGLSLERFLTENPQHAHNHQTAFFGGLTARYHLEARPIAPGDFDRALLDKAKCNLEKHVVIGLTERFAESVARIESAFGWSVAGYESINASEREAIPERLLGVVRAHNEWDLELYEFARELFGARG